MYLGLLVLGAKPGLPGKYGAGPEEVWKSEGSAPVLDLGRASAWLGGVGMEKKGRRGEVGERRGYGEAARRDRGWKKGRTA